MMNENEALFEHACLEKMQEAAGAGEGSPRSRPCGIDVAIIHELMMYGKLADLVYLDHQEEVRCSACPLLFTAVDHCCP